MNLNFGISRTTIRYSGVSFQFAVCDILGGADMKYNSHFNGCLTKLSHVVDIILRASRGYADVHAICEEVEGVRLSCCLTNHLSKSKWNCKNW